MAKFQNCAIFSFLFFLLNFLVLRIYIEFDRISFPNYFCRHIGHTDKHTYIQTNGRTKVYVEIIYLYLHSSPFKYLYALFAFNRFRYLSFYLSIYIYFSLSIYFLSETLSPLTPAAFRTKNLSSFLSTVNEEKAAVDSLAFSKDNGSDRYEIRVKWGCKVIGRQKSLPRCIIGCLIVLDTLHFSNQKIMKVISS